MPKILPSRGDIVRTRETYFIIQEIDEMIYGMITMKDLSDNLNMHTMSYREFVSDFQYDFESSNWWSVKR